MRTLSTAAKQSLFAAHTGTVWLVLLTIDHDELDEPIRVVNNTVNITSRGNEFIAFPFEVELPQEREESPPKVTLRLCNADRRVVQAIRSIQGPPTVTLEIVTSNDWDTVEIGPLSFSLNEARFDAAVVEGDLNFEPVLDEAWPSGTFNPAGFPGLF